MGVALDSPALIKSEQCVDIMVLDDSSAPKNCSTFDLVCACSARSACRPLPRSVWIADDHREHFIWRPHSPRRGALYREMPSRPRPHPMAEQMRICQTASNNEEFRAGRSTDALATVRPPSHYFRIAFQRDSIQ